ncbi:Protein SICKLE [Glycine max]|nr:Protein SICKLE [Glycine max]
MPLSWLLENLRPITSNNPSRKLGSLGGMLKYTSVETYSVLQASCLQHWFKNWQALRRNKLTASTFAAAIGFWHRQRVQLWLEKIGAIEPFSGNLATCWSNIKEEDALERYKLITGNTVRFPEFQVYDAHPEDSWLAASPDGVIDSMVHELPSCGVLEIKCPYFDGDISKAFPWFRIPILYIPQTQGLMEILGRDWMDFYVWTPNVSSLFRIYRDAEFKELIVRCDYLKLEIGDWSETGLKDLWWVLSIVTCGCNCSLDSQVMEDSEQRKKRLKQMRVQADQAEVSGGREGSVVPGFLSNPLIEAPSTMPSRDTSYAAPRFDYYTDPMSAFSSKRNNASTQAAPDNFPPSKFGGPPMAQYSSPHPESKNPQMTPHPIQASPAAYRNPVWSGPGGPAHYNFPLHPSSGGTYPSPRFEPSGGPLYNTAQGIAHQPSYSPNPPYPGYVNSPRPSYSPNPSPGYSNCPMPSYSPNPSPGYRNSPSPGQGRGRGFWRNTGSPVSGWGSGQGPNFHGHRSNENTVHGPDRFYKRSMVEDPWEHLEPIIWKANDGYLNTSRVPLNSQPWISKASSTKGEGSSAASVKSSSEPSLAEYLASAFNEAANDAENV